MKYLTTGAAILLSALAFCGCDSGDSDPTDEKASRTENLFNLRNLARLHAARDTDEGFADAIGVLKRITAASPDDFTDQLNLARAIVLYGRSVEEAGPPLARARELVKDDAALPGLDYVTGLYEKTLSNSSAAHDAFARVIAVLPQHPEALYQFGLAAERVKKLDEAEKAFNRLISQGHLVRAAAYRLSRVMHQLKRPDEMKKALALYEERKDDPKPETVKCDLAEVSLAPVARASVEPPKVELTWSWSETEEGATRWHDVIASPVSGELLLLGDAGVVVRVGVEDRTVSSGAATRGAVGDLDNDGDLELVTATVDGLVVADAADGTWPTRPGAFKADEQATAIQDIRLLDHDHDGDLDVCVLGASKLIVFRNNGDMTFSRQLELPAKGRRFSAHDVDQANDLDFIVPSGTGVAVLLNRRNGKYDSVDVPGIGPRSIVLCDDFDQDGAPDIFAAGSTPGFDVARNADRNGRPYEARFHRIRSAEGWQHGVVEDACLADIDNDGDLDIACATNDGLVLLRNAAGQFSVEAPVGEGALARLDAADLDADGVIEIAALGKADGRLSVFDPGDVGGYESIVLAPTGKKDNTGAIGTVAEIHAGRLFQSVLFRRAGGLHVGLGPDGRARFDGFYLRWPQGIRQAVPRSELPDPDAARIVLDQKEGLVASCPFLYVFGPDGWQFLTDVIAIAPLDEWLPPGAKSHRDPEEFVRVDGDLVAESDGMARFMITEELRETAYLDRVDAFVIDHDDDVELISNESTGQGRYDPLIVHSIRNQDIHSPRRVTVCGVDELAAVRERDRRYLHSYREGLSQWGGWVERHAIDIVTSEAASLLLLDGRIAWYDSTVVFSLAQHGRSWGPLRLERIDADGRAVTIVENIGVPAGMDRTMVIPLGDAPLPAGTHLRLSGQHRFLWDRIRHARASSVTTFDVDASSRSEGPLRLSRADLVSTDLHELGFAARSGDVARHEQIYHLDDAGPDGTFGRPTGLATRFGDVSPLVTAHDDKVCVLVPGDACELRFKVPERGAKKRRTWFLRISGWAKEAGYHNATGGSIAPLPFRGMSRYPPPEGESPADPTYSRFIEEWQTRRIRR